MHRGFSKINSVSRLEICAQQYEGYEISILTDAVRRRRMKNIQYRKVNV